MSTMLAGENTIYIAIAAFVIAGIGLWWFRLVLPVVKTYSRKTRFGIYAFVWGAYFVLAMMLIGRSA